MSTKSGQGQTSDPVIARARRDELMRLYDFGKPRTTYSCESTFASVARAYLASAKGDLKTTSYEGRAAQLAEDGIIMTALGDLPIARVDVAAILAVWDQTSSHKMRTRRHYVQSISAVLGHALVQGLVDQNVASLFVARVVKPLSRTSKVRAEVDSVRPNPLPRENLAALLDAATGESLQFGCFVGVMLLGGLRLGEALALRWGDVGASELHVRQSRPRGGALSSPKSGRTRRVALSGRLSDILESHRRACWNPGPEAELMAGADSREALRRGPWRRALAKAGLPASFRFKDCRATFASALVSAGIPPAFVAQQLGHGVAILLAHYAAYMPSTCGGYAEPAQLAPGETPSDLIVPRQSPERPHNRAITLRDETASDGLSAAS